MQLTCSCPGSTSGCRTSSLCTPETDERRMPSQLPAAPEADLESGGRRSYGWCPDTLAVSLHPWVKDKRDKQKQDWAQWNRGSIPSIFCIGCLLRLVVLHNSESLHLGEWGCTYLCTITWMKPVVLRWRKMSGMTSARLSTHSKQWVFKMPCNFGRMENTWLTNLQHTHKDVINEIKFIFKPLVWLQWIWNASCL